MGYDLHITRRKYWAKKGNDISAAEWLAYVRRDPELELNPKEGPYFAEWGGSSELADPWLNWSNGQIYSKNPDAKLIDKMISVARQLDAVVLGDEDEVYEAGDLEPHPSKLSLGERISIWFQGLRKQPPTAIEHDPLPFAIGDEVKDVWGNKHTVVEIDPKGLGMIRLRNANGTESKYTIIAHGLEPVTKKNPGKSI